ncbi:unnamed protein product [Blepharisma stoltei]|uniref:Uncharacterized protein n=1 Tax=Blepharisma stoltei TaxID=1481888 RepID=A0AAU9KA76_9CILI|nr:unnamed protein product [Blepharisma stoltei]
MFVEDDSSVIADKTTFITHTDQNDTTKLFQTSYTEKPTVVFKIEEAQPPEVLSSSAPLPENSNLRRVVDNIFNTMKTNNPKFTNPMVESTWKKYFDTQECKDIIGDMFWYCVIKVEKRKKYDTYKKQLLERISHNYIQLFVNVEHEDKEIFFENFYDCIAQAVFYSMYFAYPKSRSRLNSEEFKRRIYEYVSSKLTGIAVSNQGYKKWILDLGAGNVLSNQGSKQQEGLYNILLPPIRKKQTKRKMQQLRYSPLVKRYLSTKRYEAINAIPVWNMRYTLRNPDKEKELDRKFSYYRKMAISCERKAVEKDKEFQDFSFRVEEKIKEDHREYLKQIKILNEHTQKVLQENANEYANKLVAQSKKEKEEKTKRSSSFKER